MQTNDAAPALFDAPNTARYGQGELEKAVRESIDAIKAGIGIKPAKLFLAQTAIELARSIDKGNAKGRAVANESAALLQTMEILDPPSEATDPDALPEDLKEFMNAFSASPIKPDLSAHDGASLPGLGGAPASDAA
jgi:hypothetical protein